MLIVFTLGLTAFALFVRSRLSVENPGKLQVLLEDFVGVFNTLLTDFVGPKGLVYLPIVGSLFLLIWVSNLAGLVPGFMAPTSNLNVTVGCALTVWVFYHIEGIREQGVVAYFKHFAVPPGAPVALAPLMLPIELIGHLARVMSLSLRLFGNIFGEELVIVILAGLVPFIVPLPMMLLGPADRNTAGAHLRDSHDGVPRWRGRGRARGRGAPLGSATLKLRNSGTLEPWNLGTLEPWHFGLSILRRRFT